jgi:HlyD family secretion protein
VSPPLTAIATKPRRWPRLLFGFAALLLVGGLIARPYLFPPLVPVLKVERRDLVQTLVASGRVETPYRVTVSSQITGVVASVPVEEGQEVKQGDPLVVLDDREAKAAVVLAQGAVAEAEARLRQIGEVTLPSAVQSLKQAEATLRNVQQSYDRIARLHQEGYATRADFDAAQKDLDVAQTQLRSAQLQVAMNRDSGTAAVMAQTQLAQSRSSLESAQARLSYTLITAPVDGTLISRAVERGNVVKAGDTLMTLSPTGETRLRLEIDEKNLGSLKLGQSALASADAYADQRFPAELVYINPSVDPAQGSVTIKLRVPNPPAYLVQDMTVSVDIKVAERKDALIAPLVAVRDALTAAPWVWLVSDGRLVKRPVTLGARGDAQAEVLDGLKEGDLVVSGQNAGYVEDQRVRPQLQAQAGTTP